MRTLTRIATWIDAVATSVIGFVLRGVAAVLSSVLRRGRHRPWRREDAKNARSRDTTRG